MKNGKTTAVLPTGFDKIYPPSNKKLLEEISEKSLSISEIHPFTEISTGHFYRRNRIIAGLSKAVIITEAPRKSGALITAQYALQENREIYALPGQLDSPKSEGCNNLIENGANIFISSEKFLKDMNMRDISFTLKNEEKELSLSEEEKIILNKIGDKATHIDEILSDLTMDMGKITTTLFNLEYKEIITSNPGGYYKRIG